MAATAYSGAWSSKIPCYGFVRSAQVDGQSQTVTAVFVIELTYRAPLSAIDARMKAHVAFLRKYCDAGNFLVSGRQIPRVGGIILAVGDSREEIEAIMSEDPFVQHGLAEVRVIEFRTSQKANDIQLSIEQKG